MGYCRSFSNLPQDFTAFDISQQFACYVGVVPFDHSSGSSIKGKTQVTLANRKDESFT
ncbi:MAG: transposase [Cyclobacteriaceae bacterium]